MPNPFSPDMYAQGAVVFNSEPYINYATNLMARQQAKNEALQRYYQQDLEKNINPAGMRAQDMNGLYGKTGELQKFWQQNRDAIINPNSDNGRAQTEYMSRIQDARKWIANSKSLADTSKRIASFMDEPDKVNKITSDAMRRMQAHELAMDDPKHQPFTFDEKIFQPQPFNAADELKQYDKLKPNEQSNTTPIGGGKQRVTTTYYYGDDATKLISQRAVSDYSSKPRVMDFVHNQLSTPEKYAELNPIFKATYGHDIKHPEELYVAFTLGNLQHGYKTEKIERDPFAQSMAVQDRIDRRMEEREDRRDQRDQMKKEAGGNIDDYINGIFEKAKSNPREYFHADGRKEIMYEAPVSEASKKIFAYKDQKKNMVYPDAIRFSQDGSMVTPIFTKGDEKNGKKAIDMDNSKPVSLVDVKARWSNELFGTKGAAKAVIPIKSKIALKKGEFD